jgi:integrase
MANLFNREGVWYINYRIGGKQHRKSTRTRNRRLAEIALKDLEVRLFRGEMTGSPERKGGTSSIATMFRRYELHVEQNTVHEHARHVEHHLEMWQQFFAKQGTVKPSDINAKAVDDFLAFEITDCAPETKREYLTNLKACLNRAVRWRMLSENPIKHAHYGKKVVRRINFFSKEDIRKILDHSPENLKVAVSLLVNTGMRLGELWALRWEDVDFRNRQIWVRAYDGFTPKGKRDRNIPMNRACNELLKELHSKRTNGDLFVYRRSKSERALSVQFKYHAAKNELRGRLHDLRHTFASHLVMEGAPLPVVQELLGHAQITTTMVYAHLAPNIHRDQVNRLSF